MNQRISLVRLAVERAWADAANATEAKDRYLEMLKTDEALRTEATARYLEKIAIGTRLYVRRWIVICSRSTF